MDESFVIAFGYKLQQPAYLLPSPITHRLILK
jgi:hypothetical protein